MQQRARDVGILGLEIYFPKTYISQAEFEKFNNVSAGKYTIGLAQKNMAFVGSNEDINSISLTVVQNLLEKYKIDPREIGRLEVGTETLIDKSKSTKTFLMELFSKSGNNDIEGVSSVNACYGATNALFNTVNWIQSESWDGRLGIVVAADVAVYEKGPARPTGGVGSVAILVGANAPIVFENVRSTFITHAYDFYKPNPTSEFPIVDGQLSVKTYFGALENCYSLLKSKLFKNGKGPLNLDTVDYCCFHSPFGKQVYRAFIALLSADLKAGVLTGSGLTEQTKKYIEALANKDLNDKSISKEYAEVVKAYWSAKGVSSTLLNSELGNIYTGSLFCGLISLIANEKIPIENKKILMFSYGSGLASSMFILRFTSSVTEMRRNLDLHGRLLARIKVPVEVYDRIMDERVEMFHKKGYTLETNLEHLEEGAFYLVSVDDKYRRTYARKISPQNALTKNNVVSTYIQKQNENEESKSFNPSAIGGAVSRLASIKNHITAPADNDTKINEKLIWTGFHKKTFNERLDHV